MSDQFILKYDGRDASHHRIDMALLGHSLIGVDQAVHRGVWACMYPDIRRGRKRAEISIQVQAPRAACVEISGNIEGLFGFLPFMYQVVTGIGSDYVKHLLSAVILHHGGRREDANMHLEKMMDLYGQAVQSSYLDRSDERRLVAEMHSKSLSAMQGAIELMLPQAKRIVSPVGRTAETLKISGSNVADATEIDAAIAEAVRSGDNLIVGDMDRFEIKIDGMIRQNSSAKVILSSDSSKIISADIRDPIFDDFPNVYTDAFSEERELSVWAKPTYKDDVIVKLHILSAI